MASASDRLATKVNDIVSRFQAGDRTVQLAVAAAATGAFLFVGSLLLKPKDSEQYMNDDQAAFSRPFKTKIGDKEVVVERVRPRNIAAAAETLALSHKNDPLLISSAYEVRMYSDLVIV
jgi:hypothetical protein